MNDKVKTQIFCIYIIICIYSTKIWLKVELFALSASTSTSVYIVIWSKYFPIKQGLLYFPTSKNLGIIFIWNDFL